MSTYFLPKNVYFGCRGDNIVFLDLHRDEYVLVTNDGARAVLSLAPGASSAASDIAKEYIELLGRGLLTTDGNHGKSVSPTLVDAATQPLLDGESRPRIRASHVWPFLCACIVAAFRLRFYSIERTVELVQRRKLRAGPHIEVDLERARALTDIFRRLRSFFPRNYLCLYDSLALIEFLAHYQVFPSWVFGVKLEPWCAHCWVQAGSFVFNEDVEVAATHTAVMAI
jgi:hypothetical protein